MSRGAAHAQPADRAFRTFDTDHYFAPMPSRRVLLFFLSVLGLCSWHLDSGHNDNTMSRALAVAALVEHGSLEITAHHALTGDKCVIDGRYFSDKAPLPVFLVAPFWWLASAAGLVRPGEHGYFNDHLLQLGGFLCGSLPLALILTLLWLALRRKGAPSPVAYAVVPVVGSFLFVYSGSFFGHLPGALFLLLAWNAIEREQWIIAGSLAACAVLCEYTLAVIPTTWLLAMFLRDRRRTLNDLPFFLLGTAPWILALLLYNRMLTGSAFSPGYAHEANYAFMNDRFGFQWPTREALYGLTFSAYRGLLFYLPILWVGLVAWLAAARSHPLHAIGPIGSSAGVLLLVVAAYAMWWGGWAYGPRHLTAAAVLLVWRVVPLIAVRRWLRWPAFLFGSFGVVCAYMAKSTTWYSLPTGVKDPVLEEVVIRFANGEFTSMQVPVLFGASPATATFAFPLVAAGVLFALHRMDRRMIA